MRIANDKRYIHKYGGAVRFMLHQKTMTKDDDVLCVAMKDKNV